MIYSVLVIAAGLAALVFGAGKFVDGAVAIAKRLDIPQLLIGLLIVGCGTSMPELIVSATAAYHNNPGIALGNVVGASISNLALILGVSACIAPVLVPQIVISRQLPLLLAMGTIWILFVRDGRLTRLEGAVFLAAFVVATIVSIRRALSDREQAKELEKNAEEEVNAVPAKAHSLGKAVAFAAAGLGVMLASSEALVWGAVRIAEHFGVNELVIGLTIVSVGTSLPELASSVVAARRGQHDLALGNVLGSVTFNLMVVAGVAALINPLAADFELIHRDSAALAILGVMLCVFCLDRKPPSRISRGEGAVLALSYAAYTALLIFSAGNSRFELW